jgi:ADP-heptose:LPS heptosyltransferase
LKIQQYAAAMYHDLLKGLSINSPCPELAIKISKQDIEWADKEQQRLLVKESGYILIHGGSSQLAKRKGLDKIYPVENWLQIIQGIQNTQPDIPVVVIQGPDDQELVSSLKQAAPEIRITSPEDVGKLAAIIAGANLMLCTDSAPMHLSVAVQTYTIALFGPTDPAKLLPKSDKFIAIKSSTGQMSDISPKAVLEKIWGG